MYYTLNLSLYYSAGVGRTGTFITLFTQLQRMAKEKNLDIFGFVRNMRYRRNCMVQTEVRQPLYTPIHSDTVYKETFSSLIIIATIRVYP